MIDRAIRHIKETARIPSFSTYEDRLHPYIRSVFNGIPESREIDVKGNNLIFQIGQQSDRQTIALAAHLDKIDHYGQDLPDDLPVDVTEEYIEGAMDDCAGLGMMIAIAEASPDYNWPNLLFFFSEMEESKGLKEHPERLKNNGEGYTNGMGARRIAKRCLDLNMLPDKIITLDTTPLFEGIQGIALYSKHWELNDLEPSAKLIEQTEKTVAHFIYIDPEIKIDNNTNDYLHYGEVFNKEEPKPVVSVALEPAIYPYHQKGERVSIGDIQRCLDILANYLSNSTS
jgi:di/tripeptidase